MSGPAPGLHLEQLIHSTSPDDLQRAVTSSALTEDLALALLKRRDLPAPILQELARNSVVTKHHSVLIGLITHAKTPRFVSLPLVRQLHTFEMLNVATSPATPPDVKMAVEQAILDRLEQLSLGERITLAKRGSTRIAERLLRDPELKVVELALQNPYLTEACIVRTLMSEDPPEVTFVEKIAHHPKWSLRTDIRCALLRNLNTPLAVALHLAQTLPADVARDALFHSNLPHNIKTYLMSEIQHRPR